jgi:anthranilate synthase component 1
VTISPSFEQVSAREAKDRPYLLSSRLVSDLETPVSAYLKLIAAFCGPSFLLESVEGGAVRGRYSMIGLAPDLIWRCQDGKAALNRQPENAPDAFAPCPEPPLEALRALIAESAIPDFAGLPPMSAGVFGYLGYDMVREMEHLPSDKPDPIGVPDALMIRPTVIAVFDAVKDEIVIVTPVRPAGAGQERAAYESGVERLEAAIAAVDAPLPHDANARAPDAGTIAPSRSNTTEAEFRHMVARAKEYILAGDIFQVVLSQRFETPFTLPPFALYRALRRVNPSPFLSFLNFGDFQFVCSSPEILVRVRDGKVTIRPIAGTRPRGATSHEDQANADSLLADPKERAEHLMLLDLGRNDAGRVSEIGSVTVTESFGLEYYSQVMHIVSNVEGKLDPAHDTIDALVAGFPAGTVSGAPKVRAMQIIDEFEKHKRGPYAGCIGYFGADGALDTCIVLRTAIVKDGVMHVQAGAGIVHDSDPASEQQECINKAKALFRAAEEAVRFASRGGKGQ